MRRISCRLLAAISLLAGLRDNEAAARPRYGGTLRIEMRETVRNLDPAEWPADASTGAAKARLVSLMFEPLVRLGAGGQPEPALALSWQHDPASRHWRFRLRPNVKFDDGAALTADAAAAALRPAADAWQVSASGSELLIESELPMPDLLFDLSQASKSICLRGTDTKLFGTGPFRVERWEPGRSIHLVANEQHWAGRPFLDAVSIEMSKPLREQMVDLELGRADFVEIWPNEVRRLVQRGMRIWASAPNILIALTFERGRPATEDARVREAIALSVDRSAMLNVLLQKQGEPALALLPQQVSGYAFLFPSAFDVQRARRLVAGIGQTLPPLSLGYDASDPLARAMAERIAVNAREAGLTLQASAQASSPDLRLLRLSIRPPLPEEALSSLISSLRLTDLWPPANNQSPEALYASERAVVDSYRVIPLFHLAETYGSSPRLKTWATPGVLLSGNWRLDDLWLEAEKP